MADGDDDEAPADAAADPALAASVAAARPELDEVRLAVMRARARAALFGATARVAVGRYELAREVDTGGGGTVFVARDPELDREIAIKLIRASEPARRTRALAEAQALARLAHPNVVPVFDVGAADDRVYLAMELVRGESLRQYATHAPPRDVIRAYRQAGAGLVAAHAAGLVHRDFKPDNAVIGDDGRVRVVDFGLASADAEPIVGGTPRYMAPEQRAGAASAPADQYAFGVALREAVVRAGGEPPPRWLDAIVRRATAEDPAARYPSMTALLAALADDPRTRWKRRALVAAPIAAAGIAAAAFALGRRAEPAAPTCDDGAAALAPAWTTERGRGARDHVAGLGTPYAAASAPAIGERLDGYARTWITAHAAACRAARTEPSALVTYRRAVCLSHGRDRLGAALEVLASADVDGLPGALVALSQLPDLAPCADPDALRDELPEPPRELAGAVAAFHSRLDRAAVRVDAGVADAADETARVVTAARALGYQPLLARALLVHGHALDAAGQASDGAAPLTESVDLAIALGADAVAVEAEARLLRAVTLGQDRDQKSQVLAELRPVLGLAARLGPGSQFAVALLRTNAGVLELAFEHPDRARVHWELALPIARELTGEGSAELAWVRLNLANLLPSGPERDALLDESVAAASQALGADHPLTLRIAIAAGSSRDTIVGARASLGPACERLAALHPGQTEAIVRCSYELGILDLACGEPERAATAFERLGIAPSLVQDDTDPLAAIAGAFVELLAGRRATALAAFERYRAEILATPDLSWLDRYLLADIGVGRAMVGRAAGKVNAELTALEDAIADLAPINVHAPVVVRRQADLAARLAGLRARR